MSSFTLKAKHKVTGQEHNILCLDDYFGRRRYGYIAHPHGYIPNVKGSVALTEAEFYEQYDVEDGV